MGASVLILERFRYSIGTELSIALGFGKEINKDQIVVKNFK